MELRLLKELVKKGEGEHLEFKLKSNHPEKIVREVVAFANSGGGKLLVGVGDDKAIKGLKDADEDEYTLSRAIDKYIFPKISFKKERVAITPDRDVLVLTIPRSVDKPHYVVDDTGARQAYIRVEDKSIQASREMKEIMRRGRGERDVSFQYGEKEEKLMKLLDEKESVTVDLFATVAGIPRKIASNTLVVMVLARILEVHPHEMIDKFTMSMAYQSN
ncbi:putative HTH transcriptional regulator [Dyadobacter sp. BE34]|uniref:HTH transcriptional regulator n=1 Tax=Dyadobacter fermentans TaxID=94254 RepID=A0ABU1R7P9_9BACT|nr:MULTISPECIES: ATP-binding protein [Dyadobacter]MBZ1363129.1 ATP-binding protein [Dyadobacter fermentans]MDR6809427.1 putative HTH transcriptional regulator [Dyadobacter fermentans]MDR7047377.1 putative HTH transcriptional regulator [Dyadobacter sp. BE242]MDR7195054.1 putative HTH transcriptional regulator [Dyadobacter sp. BE34]MDR7214401.1 putative HTH transcriptional regulator [Dyadobacter sp. BE31]